MGFDLGFRFWGLGIRSSRPRNLGFGLDLEVELRFGWFFVYVGSS